MTDHVQLRQNVLGCWVCALENETFPPLGQRPAIESLGVFPPCVCAHGQPLACYDRVTHPKDELVYGHLLLSVVVHEWPR